mgnify:CR=1 FL=1
MINQNFLRVYRNSMGAVTIATGFAGESPFESIQIEMISIANEDLLQISRALNAIAEEIGEEEENA